MTNTPEQPDSNPRDENGFPPFPNKGEATFREIFLNSLAQEQSNTQEIPASEKTHESQSATSSGEKPGEGKFVNPNQMNFPGAPQYYAEDSSVKSPRLVATKTALALMLIASVLTGLLTAWGVTNFQNSSNTGNTPLSNSPLYKTPEPRSPSLDSDTVTTANDVLPRVVSIQLSDGSSGSGSIISSDGVIMTNNHVVASATNDSRVQMAVSLTDGTQYEAEVIATDPTSDIAVIKAKGAQDLPTITFADSDKTMIGEQVLAVGSPLGLDATVTSGIISAVNRPVQAGGRGQGEQAFINALQTDAAINPGNSGGALVNMQGELVGIPSVIATLGLGSTGSIGLGFAIPANQARKVAEQLIENGSVTYPIIGAQIANRPDIFGAVIADVEPGLPADKAGLKAGDVIVEINGEPIDSGTNLISTIRAFDVGDVIRITVENEDGNDPRTVELTLVAQPQE